MGYQACSDCISNCQRKHSKEKEKSLPHGHAKEAAVANELEKPAFMKKMLEGPMTSTMQFPTTFLSVHGDKLEPTVCLETQGGMMWQVEVVTTPGSGTMSTRAGWKKFVADFGVQVGDHLVFTLTGKSHFQVQVFNSSGGVRGCRLGSINSPKYQTTPAECTPARDESPGHGQMPSVAGRHLSLKRKKRSNTGAPIPSSKKKVIELDSSASISTSIDGSGNETTSAVAQPGNTPEVLGTPKRGKSFTPHRVINGVVVSQRRAATQEEKVKALSAAESLMLSNPHCLMVMSKAYVYKGFWLGLPRMFCRDWMPKESREITLVDVSEDQEWPVKWLYRDGTAQTGMSGGWRRFALDHHLEESDVCVFELVNPTKYIVKVHIFTAVNTDTDEGAENSLQGDASHQKANNHQNLQDKGNEDEDISAFRRTSSNFTTGKASSPRYGSKTARKKIGQLPVEGMSPSTPKSPKVAEQIAEQVVEQVAGNATDVKEGKYKARPKQGVSKQKPTVRNKNRFTNGTGGCEIPAYVIDGSLEVNIDYDVKKPASAEQSTLFVSRSIEGKGRRGTETHGGDETTPTQVRSPGMRAIVQYEQSSDLPHPKDSRASMLKSSQGSQPQANENKPEGQLLYKVVQLHRGRDTKKGVEFLVELEGVPSHEDVKGATKDKKTGFWWVPHERFEWGMDNCLLG